MHFIMTSKKDSTDEFQPTPSPYFRVVLHGKTNQGGIIYSWTVDAYNSAQDIIGVDVIFIFY